jgi:hypothetical protein
MKKHLLAAIARIDALPQRERLALLGGLVAAAIGVQAMWALPLHDKRVAIARSAADTDRSQREAETVATEEKTEALELLRTHAADLERKLAALGLKASQREPVAGFVTRTLRGNGVRLTALTALPVEELALPGTEADASAPAATAAATLYRHRAEVRVEGPVQGVVQAIDQLERQLAPLRIERVRLTPAGSAGAVQANVVLTTISQERTWLAL